MKKIIGIFTFMLIAVFANAQNDYGGNGNFGRVFNGDGWLRPGGGNNKNPGKGVFKIALEGLPYKIGLGYERVLTDKITFGVDALYQLPQQNSKDFLDVNFLYEQVVSNNPELGDTVSSLFPDGKYGLQGSTVNRFFVMPEVRLYFKEAPRGFYTGLFFKYRAYDYANKFLYTDSSSQTYYDYDVDVQMNTASIGLSLGFQTFITKTISLDIVLFGIQYSSNIGYVRMNTNTTPISNEVQSGVKTAVDFINTELPVSDLLRIVEVSDNKVDLESRFNSPSIRLPSIRLGLRF